MSDFIDLTDTFKEHNQYHKIVAVLDSDDYYKIASTTHEVLKSIPKLLPTKVKREEDKVAQISSAYRGMGNQNFTEKNYGDALQLYNLAALYAPRDSTVLALALSNRSALYCRIKRYSAALRDIETCLALGMDEDLSVKLEKRRDDCAALLWQEPIEHNNLMGEFNDSEQSEEFFRLRGKCNPKFPFAKCNIDLIMRNGKEHAFAKYDIEIGDLIAIEQAFVSHSMEPNRLLFCYYCHKYADNLIPCETCSHALFCSDFCQKSCWEQYHEIECHMIEIYKLLPVWYNNWFKFVIKSWTQSQYNMEKFAKVSLRIDKLLQEPQSDEDVMRLDINNIASYLKPPHKEHIKKYGKIYDASIFTSLVVNALKYLPTEVLRTSHRALFAEHVAKQLMYHVLHSDAIELYISGAMLPLGEDGVIVNNVDCLGVYPLLSRVQHCCDPNLFTVGLGNKLALVATKRITAGTPLTIAYGGEYVLMTQQERQFYTYNLFGFVCECRACKEDWQQQRGVDNADLKCKDTESLVQQMTLANDRKDKYKIVCEAMARLPSGPNNKAYQVMYNIFRHMVSEYQHGVTKQRFVGNAEELEKNDFTSMFDFLRRFLR